MGGVLFGQLRCPAGAEVLKEPAPGLHALALAGPRTAQCRDAEREDGHFGVDRFGRPREAPWFPAIKPRKRPPSDAFSPAEIAAWLAACHHATAPELPGCRPEQWWRALVGVAYWSGARIGTILRIGRDWIRPCAASPGWATATVPAAAYKGHSWNQIVLPPRALAAIEAPKEVPVHRREVAETIEKASKTGKSDGH